MISRVQGGEYLFVSNPGNARGYGDPRGAHGAGGARGARRTWGTVAQSVQGVLVVGRRTGGARVAVYDSWGNIRHTLHNLGGGIQC